MTRKKAQSFVGQVVTLGQPREAGIVSGVSRTGVKGAWSARVDWYMSAGR